MPNTTINSELTVVFSFLKEVIIWRVENPDGIFEKDAPTLPLAALTECVTIKFIKEKELTQAEIVIFILTLVPYVAPDFLLNTVSEAFPSGTDLPQFGGIKGKQHRGILPTGETAQFILAGNIMSERMRCITYFSENETFEKNRILYLDRAPDDEPILSGRILLYPEIFYLVTTGIVPAPKRSADFPAEKLETALTFDDLILNDKTMEEIQELQNWLNHHHTFYHSWGMKDRVKAGYRVLFHGPPGTGKTLTASLLGKHTGHPVYRIDLSTIVSKYIGETEKNLANLFDKAAHKDWILFFDEADAIFGKRTNVQNSNDKYANQEVSYLLQRVESHPGLVILASNFKDNIDDAFMRRFQSICEFEKPSAEERYQLWTTNLPSKLKLHPEIDLQQISDKYELTGSHIVNIIQYCSIDVLSRDTDQLTTKVLTKGIRKEFTKEDRLF